MTTIMSADVASQLADRAIAEAGIAELAAAYLPLTIAGVDDLEGYREVHSARMVVRKKRTSIEKVRKALKADALAYGRTVDGEAKHLADLLAPIEEHLLAEEKAVDDEKERIQNERVRKEEALIKARLDAEAAEAQRIEDAEKAQIKAEQDAENERLRVEREKLEAERKAHRKIMDEEEARQREAQEKLDAQQRVIDAEKKRLADIEAERLRAEELKKAKADAAEKAQKDTEARVAREKEEAEAKVIRDNAARKRAEELKPDREKILSVADALRDIPALSVSTAARSARGQVEEVLLGAIQEIYNIAENLE